MPVTIVGGLVASISDWGVQVMRSRTVSLEGLYGQKLNEGGELEEGASIATAASTSGISSAPFTPSGIDEDLLMD